MSTRRKYPRTPWINATHQFTLAPYRFHISRTRHKGKLTFTLAPDSPTSPNQVRCIKPSRPNWGVFVDAAERLLDLAMWDPDNTNHNNTAHSQTIWNRNKRSYQTMSADVDVVVGLLPQLITPVSGTSLRKLLQRTQGKTSNVRTVSARTNRYAEIMRALSSVLSTITPLHEKLQDARHMKGYSKEEVNMLASDIATIVQAAQHARRKCFVMENPKKPEDTRVTPPPITPPADPNMYLDPIDFPDSEESPLSPQEQSIGEEQERQPEDATEADERYMTSSERELAASFTGVKFHPGSIWRTPEYQRHLGWDEVSIARSQRIGHEEGHIKVESEFQIRKGFTITQTPEEQ